MGEPISPNSFLDTTRLHRWLPSGRAFGAHSDYLHTAPSALTLTTFTPRCAARALTAGRAVAAHSEYLHTALRGACAHPWLPSRRALAVPELLLAKARTFG